MKKQNGIRAVLWTVLMLAAALTGCCADGENVCTLDPADPARFTCGGVEYITLREAVPRDAGGASWAISRHWRRWTGKGASWIPAV